MANEYVKVKSEKAIQISGDPKQVEKNRLDITSLDSVIDGGDAGDLLVKNSSTDKDASWKSGSGSGIDADLLDGAHKSTTTTLGTSDALVPTQKAVKTYVDTNALWKGSNKIISSSSPDNGQGVEGDFWFQYV